MTDIEETRGFRRRSYGRYTGNAIVLGARPTVMTIVVSNEWLHYLFPRI